MADRMLTLADDIRTRLPKREGIQWSVIDHMGCVAIHCMIYPGVASTSVTSLDQANAQVDGLITRADAAAVATSMTEQEPFDEPVVVGGSTWSHDDDVREIAPASYDPMIDDRWLDDAGEEAGP